MSCASKCLAAALCVASFCTAAERGNRIIYLADGVISDEIEIGPYLGDYKDETNPNMEEAQDRHYRLKAFLQNMGW